MPALRYCRPTIILACALSACSSEVIWLSQGTEETHGVHGPTGDGLLPSTTLGTTTQSGETSSTSTTTWETATTSGDLGTLGTTGTTETGVTESGDDSDLGERRPMRDTWRKVLETRFEDDGQTIKTLRIGGRSHLGNFANRGNVEVLHDTEGNITVEMRRFSFAHSPEEAQSEFARIKLWAYTGVELDPEPEGPSGSQICDANAWHEGCQLRVWYADGPQPDHTGADLRVHLPKDFRGHLIVITEDNDREDGYPDRGDILIDGLESSLVVDLDAGTVDIRRRMGGHSAIDCSPAEIEHCSDVDWFPKQGCACDSFAWLELHAQGASNITLDLGSASLIAKIDARNNDPSHTPGSESMCAAKIDCANFENCELVEANPRTPWFQQAHLNVEDVAFRARPQQKMTSATCQKLMVAEDPEDYWLAKYEIHGNLTVCNNDGRGC